jgi:hypothetical protein
MITKVCPVCGNKTGVLSDAVSASCKRTARCRAGKYGETMMVPPAELKSKAVK